MCNCKRYKDIIIKNYVYYSSNDAQFGAYTLVLPNNSICIVFQGTDDTIGSWKDNFELLYKFPTTSQKYAIKYLDSAISNNYSLWSFKRWESSFSKYNEYKYYKKKKNKKSIFI